MKSANDWQNYEEVARLLLDRIAVELGLERVEGKQYLPGKRSGTQWEVDAKGVSLGNDGFVVIEIRRRTTTRLSQEAVAAIAYRIEDTGGIGGIIVSPLPLQIGARKIASSSNIIHIQLNEDSTTEQFILRFLHKIMLGIEPDALNSSASVVGITLTSANVNGGFVDGEAFQETHPK